LYPRGYCDLTNYDYFLFNDVIVHHTVEHVNRFLFHFISKKMLDYT